MSYSIYFGADSEGPHDGSLELLWPVLKYDIDLIQYKNSNDLNLFEQTLLDMLKATNGLDYELADMLCMERDTIRFLLERLQHKGFIDDNGEPVEKTPRAKAECGEHKLFSVFYDVFSGEFFPWLMEDEYIIRSDIERLPKEITDEVRYFVGDNRNVSHDRRAYCLCPPVERCHRFLAPEEIIPLLRKNGYKLGAGVNYSSGINGQLVFLRVWLCRSKSTGNYLIQNPFRREYNPSLIATLKKMAQEKDRNQPLIEKMMDRLSELTESEITMDNVGENPPKGFTRNMFNYGVLANHIIDADKAFQSIVAGESDSKLGGDNKKSNGAKFCKAIFAAIEESLHIVYTRYEAENWDKRLMAMKEKRRRKFLLDAAKSTGFKLHEKFRSDMLVNFNRNQMSKFVKEGNVVLPVVLALNIACANDNQLHPFRGLAQKDKNLFDFISFVRDKRNEAAHGQSIEVEKHEAREAYGRFLTFLRYMLPEIIKDNLSGLVEKNQEDDWQSEILRAMTVLRQKMGVGFISSVGHNLSDSMVQVEQKRLGLPAEDDDRFQNLALDIITKCAGILQQLLQLRMSEANVDRSLTAIDIKNLAAKQLVKCECLQEEELPDTLRFVKKNLIENAGQPNDRGSLGSEYIAWLGHNPRGDVTLAAEANPESFRMFYSTVTALLAYRGHGNVVTKEISLSVLDALLDNFRKGVFLFWENGFISEKRDKFHG